MKDNKYFALTIASTTRLKSNGLVPPMYNVGTVFNWHSEISLDWTNVLSRNNSAFVLFLDHSIVCHFSSSTDI